MRERAANKAGSVLLESSRQNTAQIPRSFLFQNPEKILIAHNLEEVLPLLEELDNYISHGKYAAGFLTYEAGYAFEKSLKATFSSADLPGPLAWFGIYTTPEVFDHSEFETEQALGNIPPSDVRLNIGPETYSKAVRRIHSLIEAGDTYQANLTFKAQWRDVRGPEEIFAAMMKTQPVEYGALIHTGDIHILSASPEMFFHRRENEIATRPMKGTARRGRWLQEDEAQMQWLQKDEKNRSENLMIVDLLRNDLGRVCESGSISVPQLFTVERFPTVLQMTSTIKGQLKRNCTYADIFQALFPCGSIVGAPKIRTMQILHDIEQKPRGLYTGAIGYISPDKEAVFSVAIRTVVLKNHKAEMGVGSGIVYDSVPEDEYAECKTKTAFLSQQTDDFQLIETLLWDAGYAFLQEHIERLENSAAYFQFSFDKQKVKDALQAVAHGFGCGSQHRVRLLLDKYGTPGITSFPISLPQQEEISVLLAGDCISSSDVMLFHKTTLRDQYNQAFERAHRFHCHDAIFLNEQRQITEGCIHNLFVVKDNVWFTPAIDCGLLPGIYRQHLLQTKPNAQESIISVDHLLTADEIYLCNSVRGLRKVKRLLCETTTGVQPIWKQSERLTR